MPYTKPSLINSNKNGRNKSAPLVIFNSMNVHIITIGDEILIGQIVDTNSAWMGRELNLQGIHISGISTVADEEADIHQALRMGLEKADAVLITGGLGPTKDDVTKKALASFTGSQLAFHEATYERIQRFFERLGKKPTEAHRLQSFMPTNASMLTNRMGTAPAMWIEHENKVIVSMPGVPYEMKALMEQEVVPRLLKRFKPRPVRHRTLLTAGEGESRIAERIQDLEEALPTHIKLAYLPNLGQVRLRLSGKGEDQAVLDAELDQHFTALRERLDDLVFGEEQERLEAVVGQMLKEHGMTLCTAESCTGGRVSHLITSVPGSSAYFKGGLVAYSNEVKQQQLGVKATTLEQHGAVSEQTVREMAEGAIKLFGTDLAIAISGIAGPGGGSDAKPVGTIWMAVSSKDTTEAFLLRAGKDRLKNIQYASSHALNFIRRFLLQQIPAAAQ
jgi:nicotinamide-nucleotide amidase